MGEPVVLVTGVDPGRGVGGHSSYVRAHAWAAQRAGFDPHVVCLGGQAGTTAAPFGIVHRARVPSRLDHLPGFKAREHQMFWRVPFLARAVARVADAASACLVHGFGFYGAAAVLAARRLRRKGRSVASVTSAYDTLVREGRAKLAGMARGHGSLVRLTFAAELWVNRLLVNPIERRGYAEAMRVLVNYDSVRRILDESYGIAGHVRKVAYSSELAFVALPSPAVGGLSGVPEGTAPLVVAVSRQDPRKGIDVLLRALARVAADGVSFRAVLVGGGPLLEAHRRLRERLGLDRIVGLPGVVPESWPYLTAADVFVLPSLEEGSGSIALLEAFQAGTAAVVSGVDGLLEDVVDGDNGLLAKPGDAVDLARALRCALSEPQLRRELGTRGRATFETRFSPEIFVRDLRAAYAEIGVEPRR